MAKAKKLKVFRTPIGFHDAYVAAPSQKAALEAWGADSNLFAQGIAEQVTDEALMAEALASPGKVVRVARGSADEHVRAVRSVGTKKGASTAARSRSQAKARKVKVRPDRSRLAAAEEDLAAIEKAHRAELRALDVEQRALERKRREADRAHEAALAKASAAVDNARRVYDRAMRGWRE